MCADMNGITSITLNKLRREELMQQAKQYRRAQQATRLNPDRGLRRTALCEALQAIRVRIGVLQRRSHQIRPIDLAPAPPKTT